MQLPIIASACTNRIPIPVSFCVVTTDKVYVQFGASGYETTRGDIAGPRICAQGMIMIYHLSYIAFRMSKRAEHGGLATGHLSVYL